MADIDVQDFFRSPTATYRTTTYPFIDPTRPELSTKDKTAIVTGGGRPGIGSAIAESLAKSGVSALGLLGRTKATLLQTKESIEKLSPNTKVFLYAVDILDAKDVAAALDSFATSTGAKIDILAANAGYMPYLTSITGANPEDWWRAFEVNIKGNFNLLRAYVPHAAKDGVVVHTSSSAIHIPYMPGYSSYRGSKAGATKVFEIFAYEMAELGNGVRTIQIHPGLVKTTMSDKFGESVEGFPFDDRKLSRPSSSWRASLTLRFSRAEWRLLQLGCE